MAASSSGSSTPPSGVARDSNSPITVPGAPIGLPIDDRTEWSYNYMIQKPFDCPEPPNFRLKLETGVKNGDCLPACFTALLECMHRGCITSNDLEVPANYLRQQLIRWIKKNWNETPIFNPEMEISEIMWMQHDLGIPSSEREKRGSWGNDASSRLSAYSEQCDKIYFSDTEMLMFSCMMYEKRGLPFLFRTYRCTGAQGAKATHIANTPNVEVFHMLGIKECVVVDMDHNGSVDGFSAHYKLLDGASIEGLTAVHKEPRSVRRRLTKADGRPVGAEEGAGRHGLAS